MVVFFSGWDPTGSSGISVDTRVAEYLNVPYLGIVTTLTFQDHINFYRQYPVEVKSSKKFLVESIKAGSQGVVVKVGAVGSELNAKYILKFVKSTTQVNYVVMDPVLASSTGGKLYRGSKEAYMQLVMASHILTPTLNEAVILLKWMNKKISLQENPLQVAKALMQGLDGVSILLKTGDATGGDWVSDYLVTPHCSIPLRYRRKRGRIRGTGCVMATLIACQLQSGFSIRESVEKSYRVMEQLLDNIHEVGRGIFTIKF